jgi:hypothetical protein
MAEMVRGDSGASLLERLRWGARDRLRNSAPIRRAVIARRHAGLVPGDFFVASYPRSGNTWLRFVIADLATGHAVDFEEVERVVPNVGTHRGAPMLAGDGRLIKTHEPHRPEYRRGVYLVRDFRDVLISWYRVTRDDPDDTTRLDEFVAAFVTATGSPYGAWHEHVRSWLAAERANPSRIAVHRFEELRADPVAKIGELARSLGLDGSPERVEQALARNTAADMRRLEESNEEFLRRSFGRMSTGVRDGSSGKWRELLSEEHLRTLEPAARVARELGYDA